MQSRAVRLTLLSLLILAGVGGAFLSWDTYRRATEVLEREREVESRLDRMSHAAAALGAAQQAYVGPGQQRGEWLGRATASVQQLYDEAAALRARMQAPESAAALRTFAETVDVAVKADDRVRENLRVGQELIAADIVYSEARQSLDAMITQLEGLRNAENASAGAERRELLKRGATIAGAWVALWLLGLIILAKAPRVVSVAAAVTGPPATIDEPIVPVMERTAIPMQAEATDRADSTPVDLGAAADVCVEISRLADASALPEVLERVAAVLDARGIVVWLGAGEELFVAAAQGYTAPVVSRLGPIARSADNPTAEAWRKGELRLVPSTPMGYGALVAPLFRPDGCFGVLAVEVRHQREHEPAAQALTMMIAAQLSTILAAGPAPSAAELENAAAVGEPAGTGANSQKAATA